MRWLTVRGPGDTDTEIYLERPAPRALDEGTASELRELTTKGAIGWVAFQRKTAGPCARP